MNPDFLKLTPVVFLLRDDTSQLTVHLQSFNNKSQFGVFVETDPLPGSHTKENRDRLSKFPATKQKSNIYLRFHRVIGDLTYNPQR